MIRPNTAATETDRLENEIMTRKIASVAERTRLDRISGEFVKIGRQRLFGSLEKTSFGARTDEARAAAAPPTDAEKLAAEIAEAMKTPEGAAMLKAAVETGQELGSRLFAEDQAAAAELAKGASVEIDPHAPGSLSAFLEKQAAGMGTLLKDVHWGPVAAGAGAGGVVGALASTDPDTTLRDAAIGATAGAGLTHAYNTKAVQEWMHGKPRRGGGKTSSGTGASKRTASGASRRAPAVAAPDTGLDFFTTRLTGMTSEQRIKYIQDTVGDSSESYEKIREHLLKHPDLSGWADSNLPSASRVMGKKGAEDNAHLEKIAGILAEALGAAIPAATQIARGDATGAADVIAPAIGGYLAAKNRGMRGVFDAGGTNFLMSRMAHDPESMLSRGLKNITDPELRNLVYHGGQVVAPSAVGAATDAVINLGNKL